MSKPKFSRDEKVIVPHKDSQPALIAGHGTIINVMRINGRWVYVIKLDGGSVHEVDEKRVERKQTRLFE